MQPEDIDAVSGPSTAELGHATRPPLLIDALRRASATRRDGRRPDLEAFWSVVDDE